MLIDIVYSSSSSQDKSNIKLKVFREAMSARGREKKREREREKKLQKTAR